MFDTAGLALIPLLPALAGVLILLQGPGILKGNSHWPLMSACVVSFVISLFGIQTLQSDLGIKEITYNGGVWFSTSGPNPVSVGWQLRMDPISGMMVPMVLFLSLIIAIFSVGYMKGDPGYPRYFGIFALFVAAMTLLVLADNIVLLYAGWEGVGVCSFLLIGFWFQKPTALRAARKAFMVTRIGDVGLLLGIFMLWAGCGYSLHIPTLLVKAQTLSPEFLYVAGFLLFVGAMGKSAQFPLHIWLPDAMEGPTPVSALIHAATMVTAGVYLVARFLPLLTLSPDLLLFIAIIGGITALLAALIALTQNDLKRILAYSTISQLGYMFMALGAGRSDLTGTSLVTFAMVAAMFHLFTHAFFKALLFLSAGSVMHSMGHVVDLRRLGGLRKVLPLTHIAFLSGSLALVGLLPFSGFWSKDEILVALDMASRGPNRTVPYQVLTWLGLITAGLTAFYTFRAYFLAFWGEVKIPIEVLAHGSGGHDHSHNHPQDSHDPLAVLNDPTVAHESPWIMTLPLLVLIPFALGIGGLFGPTHTMLDFLGATPGFSAFHGDNSDGKWVALASQVFGLGGVTLAFLLYVLNPRLAATTKKVSGSAYKLSLNRFYLDEVLTILFVRPLQILGWLIQALDRELWDKLVDSIARIPAWLGDKFRPVQNGLVQFYALAMALGLTIFLVFLAFGDRLFR